MSQHFEDQESIESLKAWWQQHGTKVMVVLVLISSGFAGWRGWEYYQQSQATKAMTVYQLVNVSAQEKRLDELKASMQTMMNEYAGSSYSSRAALLAAYHLAQADDIATAETYLQWVISKNKDSSVLPIAHLRLTELFIRQQKFDMALAQLEMITEPTFKHLVLDKRGDILLAQGQFDQAAQAYTLAQEGLAKTDQLYELVQFKLDSLGFGG